VILGIIIPWRNKVHQLQRDIVKLLAVQDKERLIVKLEGEKERLPLMLAGSGRRSPRVRER